MVSRRKFTQAAGAVSIGAVGLKFLGADDLFIQTLKPILPKAKAQLDINEEVIPTTCWIGKQDCGMLAHVVNGRIVKFEGHPDHPRNRGKLCPKGIAQISAVYDPYRVKAPLKRANQKGVSGEWQEISWDEALTIVGDRVKDVLARDKKLLVWQKGRSKAKNFYDNAFVKASGATKLHHGAFCSDAAYRACEITLGGHGGVHPDFKHVNYLLSYGWNLTSSGGNKFCWLTWPQQFVPARERGMKVVTLDPFRHSMGPHTDEWLPNKPGSDLAFFLALGNVLVEKGYIDEEYLKKHTNSPFLIKDDGYFLRVEDKEQVWDASTGSARPHDAEGVEPALEGEYTVGGTRVKTAFQLFKEHVAQYTPEWAAGITDLPAEKIRKVAEELGENAMIGSKIVIDGIELPYRPVGIMGYHVSQQELGFQAFRMAVLAFMLLGAYEAVGGFRADTGRSVHKNFNGLDNISIGDPPYNIYLNKSKFYPINSNNSSLIAHVMSDPSKYGIDYTPEVMILHMANPILSFLSQKDIQHNLLQYKFIAAIDPWMSETADYFADIVLPAATVEKYEGPLSLTDQYIDADSMRIPPIPPLYQSRGDIDIYIDLCEKIGILYGEGGYIDEINKELKLKDEYALDLNTKPTVRDIFDRYSRKNGYEGGIEFFETKGVKTTPIATKKLYAPAWDPPYGGIKHRLYVESLKRYQNIMKEKGADEIYWKDYTALPTWRTPTFWKSPSEYDLTLTSHKKIEYKQSRATMVATLNEMEPEQRLKINVKTAEAKGIKDGDEVWAESHNAVTGETRRIKVKVQCIEGIKPDTVAMPHHYGFWVHPLAKDGGPTPNTLFYTGEGYVTNTADQSFHVKVKVNKA